jgi:post-segregation antitoxin (ccd killing protein)
MPAPKSYTKAQWDEFARRLDALPEKPPSEQRVTVRDAMPNVRAHINAARAKGYSIEQLIEQAKQAGIDVTASALRYALQDAKKRRATTHRMAETAKLPGKTNTFRSQPTTHVTSQPTNHTSQTKPGSERKPGSMVHHDQFSFPIRPDTENL